MTDAGPYVAKPGDRVRSKHYPGVSGVVVRVEDHEKLGLIYHTAKGFWLAKQVTVEPKEQSDA